MPSDNAPNWDAIGMTLATYVRARHAEKPGHGIETRQELFPLDVLHSTRRNPDRKQLDRPTMVEVDQIRLNLQCEAAMLAALGEVLAVAEIEVEGGRGVSSWNARGKLTTKSVQILLGLAASKVFSNIMGDDSGAIADSIELGSSRQVPPQVQRQRAAVVSESLDGILADIANMPVVSLGQGEYTREVRAEDIIDPRTSPSTTARAR